MTAQTGRGQVGDLYWHVHHEVLCETLSEPVASRIAYIKSKKPEHEIATRLRWMTPVLGKPPAAYAKARAAYAKARAAHDKARAAYAKARAAHDKAWVAYDKAWAAYDKAWAAHDKARAARRKAQAAAGPALTRLHRKEHPGCPWNGTELVFPYVALDHFSSLDHHD